MLSIFSLHSGLRTLTSTSGVVLERAKENANCCLTYSITASEEGQSSSRWPTVINGECAGGNKKTFQEYVDDTVKYGYGLCFDGWKYVVQGISLEQS